MAGELRGVATRCAAMGGVECFEVPRERLREAVESLMAEPDLHYVTSVGVDERPLSGAFRVYHVFSKVARNEVLIVSSLVDPQHPYIQSITPVVPGAEWAEREIMDLLGIRFVDHPKPERLVLPDDWPEGVYPLRKDVPYCYKYELGVGVERALGGVEGHGVLPLGPYHPLLYEPECFELYVDGEEVIDVRYRGFHVHRGIEKLGETRLTYNQVPFLAERICGICGFTHSTCYCQAVEEAAKVEVPDRARYIRSILLELERVQSHLLWVGAICHLLGYNAGFMHVWRVREHVMELCEELTGNRKTYGLNVIGGVRRDIKEERKGRVVKVLSRVEAEFRELVDCLLSLREVKARLKGTGTLLKDDAWRLGVVGPTLRASGVRYDVRASRPYAAYGEVSFEVPVYSEGDNLARLLVRIDEIFESINIVKQLLDNMPRGDIAAERVEVGGGRVGLSMTEAPRGENFHFIMTGGDNVLYRWKVRAPTYANLPALRVMLRGCPLSDAPVTIASIDPCFSCTDRVVLVDVKEGSAKACSLRRLMRGGA